MAGLWHATARRLVTWALLIPALCSAAQTSDIEALSRAMQRAHEAVVGIEVQIVDGASSAQTLGAERQGSGVLIGDDGLVLTIGYLVLEAESVQIVTDDGRRLPARVVAYDLATGFGLVQALAPIGRTPVPLAARPTLTNDAPLTVVSGGEDAEVETVKLVSRRAFSG